MERFPYIEISWTDNEQVWYEHGKRLADRISLNIEKYIKIISKDLSEILSHSRYFAGVIKDYDKNYSNEIEALAEWAWVESEYIYMLNARTELLSHHLKECTTAYFPQSSILWQNWDWFYDFDSIVTIMRVNMPNNSFIMLNEPWIIGKIWLNSNWIWVWMNIVSNNDLINWVPIHILMRKVLDAKSLNEAKTSLLSSSPAQSSNIIIGSKEWNWLNIELNGLRRFVFQLFDRGIWFKHKNVFYSNAFGMWEELERLYLDEAVLITPNYSLEEMKWFLMHWKNNMYTWKIEWYDFHNLSQIWTLSSIMMDIRNGKIYISKWNPADNQYIEFSV